MSGKSPVRPVDLIYSYDGSFDGFLSCVFESFARREMPFAVWPPECEQPSLCPVREIPTDPDRAGRVRRGIRAKLGRDAAETTAVGFLSGQEDKELVLLRFLHDAFGAGTAARLGSPPVAEANALARAVRWEVEKLLGFVRFEESGGMLGSVIHPKHHVLPLLRGHFCARFPEEQFLIYDAVHSEALVYQNHQARLVKLAAPLALPPPDAAESYYQKLWKQFYDTLAIAQRRNERCRRNHCPKRFWADMTELRTADRRTADRRTAGLGGDVPGGAGEALPPLLRDGR